VLNALNTNGVVVGPTSANGNQVWGTDALGNPSWTSPTQLIAVDNGLYYNVGAGRIRQGGPLVENTTITEGNFNYVHRLTGTGAFEARNSATVGNGLIVNPSDNVGVGTANTLNKFTVNAAGATANTPTTYQVAIQRGGSTDMTLGSDASFAYMQSWNSKPLLLNGQGNFIGINQTTAPIQNLDINGRMNVANGVIQRGTTQINITNDLGLYSQPAGNWVRVASNSAPIKFFTDQGGGNGAGTNATMSVDPNGGVILNSNGAPATNALLEMVSTTKGVLFTRMTKAQRDAIPAPGCGLHVYNTTEQCLNWWDCNQNLWNSYCCPVTSVVIGSSTSCYNLYVATGSIAIPRCISVTVNAGVTISGCGGGACGGAALDCSGFPSGTRITIINNGSIIGKGGDGGRGGREGDAVCQADICATGGQCGGDAILGASGVILTVINNGTIAGGGGGGGGGAGGGCSAGGGGGGGAGIPAGAAGANNSYSCSGGFICGCGNRSGTSGAGGAGAVFTGGFGGNGAGSFGSGCSCNQNGASGGAGGNLGNNGSNGNSVGGGCTGNCSGAGAGAGASGFALRGYGAGGSISGGTILGPTNP
jgi:hypothetical protein